MPCISRKLSWCVCIISKFLNYLCRRGEILDSNTFSKSFCIFKLYEKVSTSDHLYNYYLRFPSFNIVLKSSARETVKLFFSSEIAVMQNIMNLGTLWYNLLFSVSVFEGGLRFFFFCFRALMHVRRIRNSYPCFGDCKVNLINLWKVFLTLPKCIIFIFVWVLVTCLTEFTQGISVAETLYSSVLKNRLPLKKISIKRASDQKTNFSV